MAYRIGIAVEHPLEHPSERPSERPDPCALLTFGASQDLPSTAPSFLPLYCIP